MTSLTESPVRVDATPTGRAPAPAIVRNPAAPAAAVRRPAHRSRPRRGRERCSPPSATAARRSSSTPRARRRSAREPLDLGPAGRRERGARGAARSRGPQHGGRADDRPRVLRHVTPARDPAQRAGEPGLVHRLHALPAGDLAGPARGAAELPDDGRGPHRPARRQRLAPRRGHGRRRGDDADAARAKAPPGAVLVVDADVLPQTSPSSPPAPSRSASASSRPTSPDVGGDPPEVSRRRRRRVRRPLQYPGTSGAVRDLAPVVAPPTSAARSSRSRPTCSRSPSSPRPASSAPTSPSARPALRRPARVRRAARRVHGGA